MIIWQSVATSRCIEPPTASGLAPLLPSFAGPGIENHRSPVAWVVYSEITTERISVEGCVSVYKLSYWQRANSNVQVEALRENKL